jgi:hypothetical protein
MRFPDFNGCRVLAVKQTPAGAMTRSGRVILVDRGPDYHDRYVTAWHGHDDSEWTWGHYFTSWLDADDDFLNRASRGY